MDTDLLQRWKHATSELAWGVQRVLLEVLELAEEGKIHLVYGSDYTDDGACLVNQAGNLLSVGGGHGIPVTYFTEVVGLFDAINRRFQAININDNPPYVSEGAAEILIRWFAPLKPEPPKEHLDDLFYGDKPPVLDPEKVVDTIEARLQNENGS